MYVIGESLIPLGMCIIAVGMIPQFVAVFIEKGMSEVTAAAVAAAITVIGTLFAYRISDLTGLKLSKMEMYKYDFNNKKTRSSSNEPAHEHNA